MKKIDKIITIIISIFFILPIVVFLIFVNKGSEKNEQKIINIEEKGICNSYDIDTCPNKCVICPPCLECSSISCQSEKFCTSIGFEKTWFEGIKQVK